MTGTALKPLIWHGCYDGSWRGLIVDDAFAHPAKMARGLVVRIFDYLFELGYLKRGALVVDPFGGIGTTAIEGASRGCRVVCCELEKKFADLALRNFDLHRRTWEACGDPLPVMVQGDSRRLCELVGPVLAECVVGSPPFSGTEQPCANQSRAKKDYHAFTRGNGTKRDETMTGQTPGQLGAMKPGDVDSVISSPPYNLPMSQDHNGKRGGKRGTNPSEDGAFVKYGNTEGQLEGLPMGDVADVILSSPPYATEQFGGGGNKHGKVIDAMKEGYGTTPGNIANLKPGSVADAVVGSPPFDAQMNKGGAAKTNIYKKWCEQNGRDPNSPNSKTQNANQQWGENKDNLGNTTGQTFWQAAREIIHQSYAILKSGGVAVWVVKAFVRNKKRVDFPGDWEKVCHACGFETVEVVHAMLTKNWQEHTLFDGTVSREKKRVSFFRRLAEKKGSPKIDWEVVLIMSKPCESAKTARPG